MQVDDAQCGLFRQLQVECMPALERFTIPIYGAQNGGVVHGWTGVLYRIGDYRFVLTASHQLRDAVAARIPLFLPGDAEAHNRLPLLHAIFHTTEWDGPVYRDVAAIKLPGDVVAQLSGFKDFLPHSRIGMGDDGRGFYCMFGYPQAWTGPGSTGGPRCEPLIYLAPSYDGAPLEGAQHDRRVSILLQFDQDAHSTHDGTSMRLPGIQGVSGCGIWRIGDWPVRDALNWDARELRLIALQHHWVPSHKYVRGTWISFALDLIQDRHPDVRSAMSLVYPRSDTI